MSDPEIITSDLTQEEKTLFDRVRSENVCLMKGIKDGVERAVICEVWIMPEDDSAIMYPLALLLTPEEVNQIQNPYGEYVDGADDDVS